MNNGHYAKNERFRESSPPNPKHFHLYGETMLDDSVVAHPVDESASSVPLLARQGVLSALAVFFLSTVWVPAAVTALLLLAHLQSWQLPAGALSVVLLGLAGIFLFRGLFSPGGAPDCRPPVALDPGSGGGLNSVLRLQRRWARVSYGRHSWFTARYQSDLCTVPCGRACMVESLSKRRLVFRRGCNPSLSQLPTRQDL